MRVLTEEAANHLRILIASKETEIASILSDVNRRYDELGGYMLEVAGLEIGDMCRVIGPVGKEAKRVVVAGIDAETGMISTYRVNATGYVSRMSGGSYHYTAQRLRRITQE